MKKDFQKEEYVVYDNVGVCLIENIAKMKFSFDRVEKMYYILRPVANQASTVYVPVDNEKQVSRMRYVMTKEEIDGILESVKGKVTDWYDDKRKRAEEFKKIIAQKDQQTMLQLASCIYFKRQELQEKGKKLSSADEQTLKEAERFVNDEFAFSLKLSTGEVASYIQQRLGITS